MIDALKWARSSTPGNVGADVVNISYGFPGTQGMEWVDWSVDYWARYYYRLIAVAAGNYDPLVPQWDHWLISPAKAWNVVTVGGHDDVTTTHWLDDEMNPNSCYVNPGGDREKPEVVAPGVNITGIKTNGALDTHSGTSYAAPQVAGLAALLIDRNSWLRIYPEAIKSIIMASAVHNVHGPSGIPKPADPHYPDLKDGAGSVDAALADGIAQVQGDPYYTYNSPCWWHDDEFAIPPTGFWYSRWFYASQGEKTRVAILWYSNADADPIGSRDVLDTNFNLYIYSLADPALPQLVASSASWSNSYEFVEFTAPDSAEYEIRVYRLSDSDQEDHNSVGIA